MSMPSSTPSITGAERQLFYDAPVACLTCATVMGVLLPSVSSAISGWPFIISLVLVGMPHGAVDFQLSRWLKRPAGGTFTFRHFLPYLFAVLMSLFFFVLAPAAAVLLFVMVSVLHFGLADARDLKRRYGRLEPALLTNTAAIVRGSLILALPFYFAPEASLKVFASIHSIVRDVNLTLDNDVTRSVAGWVFTAALVTHSAVSAVRLFRGQRKMLAVELLETGVIAASFATLHPLFAMGLYVVSWHSWRHLAAISRRFPSWGGRESMSAILRGVFRIHVHSLPLLIPTLVAFAVLAWWRLDVRNAETLAALTIAIFVVVTLPHHLLVERLVSQPATAPPTPDAVGATRPTRVMEV